MNSQSAFRRQPFATLWHINVILLLAAVALTNTRGGGADPLDLGARLNPPSLLHPLGTDYMGRDMLTRLAATLWDAVLPMWGATFAATVLGGGLALLRLAGGVGRQNIWTRALGISGDAVAVAALSIPAGITALVLNIWLEQEPLWPALLTGMFLVGGRVYLELLGLYRLDHQLAYWQAHAALGGSQIHRIWRYGLCNAWRPHLLDALGQNLCIAVAIEASLSYIGFGIQEPHASFGNMLAAHFSLMLQGHYQTLLVIMSGLALCSLAPLSLARLLQGARWQLRTHSLGNSTNIYLHEDPPIPHAPSWK